MKSIEIVTDSLHRAYLTPVKFPWTTITCTIDYDIKHIKGKSLTVDCREDAITQIFEGPKVLVDSLSSVKLLAAGSGNFFIDEAQKSFSVGVNIRVAIPIPDFYPDFLTQNMESIGELHDFFCIMVIYFNSKDSNRYLHNYVIVRFWCLAEKGGV